MKIENWMGPSPRSGSDLLKPESDHLVALFKSGASIDEIAVESMRKSLEVHMILLQNNKIYRQFVKENQHSVVLSSLDEGLSDIKRIAIMISFCLILTGTCR